MSFGSAFTNAWNKATDTAKQKVAQVATTAKQAVNTAVNKAQDIAQKAREEAGKAAQQAQEKAKFIAAQTAKAASTAKQALTAAETAATTQVKKAVEKAKQTVVNKAAAVKQKAVAAAKQAVGKAKDGVNKAKNNVQQKAASLAKKVKDTFVQVKKNFSPTKLVKKAVQACPKPILIRTAHAADLTASMESQFAEIPLIDRWEDVYNGDVVVGYAGFRGDSVVAVVPKFDWRDTDQSGSVGVGEWVKGAVAEHLTFLGKSLERENQISVLKLAAVQFTDPDLYQEYESEFTQLGVDLVKSGINEAYLKPLISEPFASLMAQHGFFVKKGVEMIADQAAEKAFLEP